MRAFVAIGEVREDGYWRKRMQRRTKLDMGDVGALLAYNETIPVKCCLNIQKKIIHPYQAALGENTSGTSCKE